MSEVLTASISKVTLKRMKLQAAIKKYDRIGIRAYDQCTHEPCTLTHEVNVVILLDYRRVALYTDTTLTTQGM
jgi:hypothetical protein